MRQSILRQIEQHAFRIGNKARRSGVNLDITAHCGAGAWLQCRMDMQVFGAMVQWEEPPGKPIAIMAIRYGSVWPVTLIPSPGLPHDLVELRDEDERLLLELLCGDTVEPAPLGLMLAGE